MDDVIKIEDYDRMVGDLIHSYIYYENNVKILILEKMGEKHYKIWFYNIKGHEVIGKDVIDFVINYVKNNYVKNKDYIKHFNGVPMYFVMDKGNLTWG